MNTFEKKELKKKSANISDWYNDVVLKAELADYAPVKGCMVIRPYGYAIWERVQKILDEMFKSAGVQNAYFPLFIPYSLLKKEKEHIAGFSPELAIVTKGGGEELKDPLVIRPTSETIMYEMYAKWIHSWRNLPMLINQWNNVVRWEKRTYLFLRTLEFLWQEAHTAHETEAEAIAMQEEALDMYKRVYENLYAIPVITGKKSETERFAGAKTTYAVEALMPDGKALQGATSHNLGQNFAKAFKIQFQNRDGGMDFVWQTSWGFSTRSMGGLFLTHGDDNGLIMPPQVAPFPVVLLPIFKKGENIGDILDQTAAITQSLYDVGISVKYDDDHHGSIGRRINNWEVKGVPLRFEIGKREMEEKTITVIRRDTGEKKVIAQKDVVAETRKMLAAIQENLFDRAKKFLSDNTHTTDSYDEFKKIMATTRGFIRALWCEDVICEAKIKEETKASTRCLPLDAAEEKGSCIYCGKPAVHRWYFAQAY